ncbi:hypothetical protein E3P99_04027 [Wallemia hederae]|uniref:Uncharacterized protein n=1 Tax=Wallemia hederae TaxID=1540922 RepID=A0A4T0FDS0_9BASI|nr:hypothetical protein E3P99_04027 [Wallemia hederae]
MPQKEVSDNPSPEAVAQVHDGKRVHEDVDRKMRLYAVITALKNGFFPSNDQISESLKYAVTHAPFDTNALSKDGQQLVKDARNVIETANAIVQNKNKDERIQNFLYKTRETKNVAAKGKVDTDAIPKGSKEESDKALTHLRTVFTLIATNSEVRKLLTDSKVLGLDLFADAASKAADVARPDEKDYSKLDEPAPEGWKTKGGAIVGADQTPELDLPKVKKAKETAEEGAEKAEDVKKAALERQEEAAKNVEDTAKRVDEKQQNGVSDLQQAVNEAGAEKSNELKPQADQAKSQADQVKSQTDGVKAQSVSDSHKQSVKDSIKDKIPEEYREKTKENAEKTKQHLQDKFPEERRRQYINRLKKVVNENQKHKDWKEAFEFFFAEFEIYKGGIMKAGDGGQKAASAVVSDPAFKSAADDLRVVLERFANDTSAKPIFESFEKVVKTAADDHESSQWFDNVVAYLRRIFLEPGYVLSEQVNKDVDEIGKTARRIFSSKYKSQIKDELFTSIADFFLAMGDDPLNKELGSSINTLFRHLLFDDNGKWTFKSELWADVRDKIVPPVVEQIGAVPIPRIEYTDPSVDIVIENLVLQGKNLFPNYVTFEAYNQLRFSPYNAIQNEHHHDIKLELGQIQCDLRDIAFYINRRKGFPKVKDAGLADVFLGGKGVSATVVLRVDSNSDNIFTVKSVKASVGTLKFKIRESKHNLLYKTFKPLATSLIKKQIVKAVQDGIGEGLKTLNQKLVDIRKEAEQGKKEAEEVKKQASDDAKIDKAQEKGEKVQQKAEKTQQKASTAQQQAQQQTQQSQFRVVANRNSQLIDAGHSQGWINLQAKYEDKVNEGDSWHSNAFSLI